jgi:hypothetical protein
MAGVVGDTDEYVPQIGFGIETINRIKELLPWNINPIPAEAST